MMRSGEARLGQWRTRIVLSSILALATSCGAPAQTPSPAAPAQTPATPSATALDAARAQLAPTGKLRVGFQNMITYAKSASGELSGVGVEISRELARRLGVPFVAVEYAAAPKLLEAAQSGDWDIAFLAIDPDRTEVVFTGPYMLVPNTYMVPLSSAIRSNADIDRPGVRIAIVKGQANDLYLTRTLKEATLVRADTRDAAFALYTSGQADAFSGTRDAEVDYAAKFTANRVLTESFLDVTHAVALPKGHAAALAFVTSFVNDVKASGLVADAIKRAGLASERVAP